MSRGKTPRPWLAMCLVVTGSVTAGGTRAGWSEEAQAKSIPTTVVQAEPSSGGAPVGDGTELEDVRQAEELGRDLATVEARSADLASLAEEEYLHSAQERIDAKRELKHLDGKLQELEDQLAGAEHRLERWSANEYMRLDDTRLGDPLLGSNLEEGAARHVYVSAAVGRDVRILEELKSLRAKREDVRGEIETTRQRLAALDGAVRVNREKALEATQMGEDMKIEAVLDENVVRASIDYPKGTPEQVRVVVEAAMSQVGVPYRFADARPGYGFDCSGLTMWAWAQVGVELSHSSRYQQRVVKSIRREDLRIGDLVFYGSPVHHVELYLGNDMVIGAPSTGKKVRFASINAWGGAQAYGRVEIDRPGVLDDRIGSSAVG